MQVLKAFTFIIKHFTEDDMKLKPLFLSILILAFTSVSIAAGSSLQELARVAISDDTVAANEAITKLRLQGQSGLDVLIAEYTSEIAKFKDSGARTKEWNNIASAIDKVAMQKDAYASGLYWFTDLEEAKIAAAATNRPILTLRLLGDLSEEFSCANSRLFRSVLYANTEISKYLRENYILHWRSVRPAPRITIDFGDGRKIERTVTGNSIHYILDESGMIIDALPGLYSPSSFAKNLAEASAVFELFNGQTPAARHRLAMQHRRSVFGKIRAGRESALADAKIELSSPETGTGAIGAAPIAVTKMLVTDEISLLRVYDDFARFEPQIDLSGWKKLSAIYAASTGLDDASVSFIRRQNRDSGLTKDEFSGLVRRLNEFLSMDTTRNDFLYRPQILDWLNRSNNNEIESFNERVYAEIFRTPSHDQWLGLYSADVYAALDGNGIVR